MRGKKCIEPAKSLKLTVCLKALCFMYLGQRADVRWIMATMGMSAMWISVGVDSGEYNVV